MRGTDCGGREDCRKEKPVIQKCKYFLLDWNKERVFRVDMVVWCARGSPGVGSCILNESSIAQPLQGGLKGTATPIPSFFMLGIFRVLCSPDLQKHNFGFEFGHSKSTRSRVGKAHAPQRSCLEHRVCNTVPAGGGGACVADLGGGVYPPLAPCPASMPR